MNATIEFASAFGIPIVEVIKGGEKPIKEEAFEGDGVCVNSGFLNGLQVDAAKQKMIEWLESEGKGAGQVQYRLRDWLFSRQRYWGEPFPLAHLEDGTIVQLPDAELPVELPSIDAYKPTEDGKPPLARAGSEWLNVTLPDGRTAMRETNIMPQWAGSCWYYLRFLDAHNTKAPFGHALEQYWMPVDLYMGGAEHAVLHLLYARFWHKVLYDCGLVSTKEPFQGLVNQGTILAESYQDNAGKYYYPYEVELKDGKAVAKTSGVPLHVQMEKMSKSRFNVINPDNVIDKYGADALRLYLLFIGPVTASTPWQDAGVEGVYRFLQRVWRLAVNEESGELSEKLTDAAGTTESELWRELHKTIKQVTEDTESADKMNTAISQMMIFVNTATQAKSLPKETLRVFLHLLSPYAPHIAQELWHRLGETGFITHEQWPTHDEAVLTSATVTIIAQVNGKLRNRLQLPADATDEEIKEATLADERVQRFIEGKPIRKVIVVPNRLINIVV